MKKAVLPDGYIRVCSGMHAYTYLIGRGLSAQDIEYYDIGIANRRIVFPDYGDDGTLRYWVSRVYEGHQGMKYFNAPGVQRSNQLYNLGRFRQEGFTKVVITEGPISAIVAGRNAVATYGKQVTERQIRKLKLLGSKSYYIALDPDAKGNAVSLAKRLASTGKKVYLVNMPDGEDPASLGRVRFHRALTQAAEFDPYNRLGAMAFLWPADGLEEHDNSTGHRNSAKQVSL